MTTLGPLIRLHLCVCYWTGDERLSIGVNYLQVFVAHSQTERSAPKNVVKINVKVRVFLQQPFYGRNVPELRSKNEFLLKVWKLIK